MHAYTHPIVLAALIVLSVAAAPSQAQINLTPAQGDCADCARSAPTAVPAQTPQAMPAAPSSPASTFHLNGVYLKGVRVLGDELDALVARYLNRDVTLSDLEALAQSIGEKYREHGYFLAEAIIPVQTVVDGVVEISVIEGRLGRINVNVTPDAPISEAVVRAFLAPLKNGHALNGPLYERVILLLSDLPGVIVSSRLEEGVQTGTTDLTVEVGAARRWIFSLDADNQGFKETGRYRFGGSVRWASPFRMGDSLDARLMISDNANLTVGRISYEGPLGARGIRGGISFAHVDYQIGGEFADLDPYGIADIFEATLNYPLIRSRRQNLYLHLGANMKRLEDSYRALDLTSQKRVTGLKLGWAWDRRDTLLGGGYWASVGEWYRGRLDIRDAFSNEADRSPSGRNTQGDFNKITLQASRLQRLIGNHSLHLSLGGQWANKNLDASEKLSLGGAQAVRAYLSSQALVDKGFIGSVEWRWSMNATMTPFVFYDIGSGWLSIDTQPGETGNHQKLQGTGIGLQWVRAGNFAVNATLAWRVGSRSDHTNSSGHSPRLLVQLQKVF
ncbi:MAG: ShlB/FhaC/HecB family hemolysin secretion/activation protein [Betaproteobacteria bacterium]|nr:ShlB/FhaC/HecB family hemolysin secretion/activation protein [Betaproteobacteria bacterium]